MKGIEQKNDYLNVIPINNLVKIAEVDITAYSTLSEPVIRLYAEKVIREELYHCVSSVDSIVDAVVDKYIYQLGY